MICRNFHILLDGKYFDAVAMLAAHNGRAALISLRVDGEEVGLVKLVSNIQSAVLKWGLMDEGHFLDCVCSQFIERNLAKAALSSPERPGRQLCVVSDDASAYPQLIHPPHTRYRGYGND